MDDKALEYRIAALRELKYLPMFFLLPKEFLVKRKLDTYPRDPIVFATDPHWNAVYHSDYFQVQLIDTWAWMMWQTFGIRGGFDSYSTNEPFVRTAANFALWTAIVVKLGMTTDMLALLSEDGDLPFPSEGETAHNCAVIAQKFWGLPTVDMKEILKVVQEHRSHDDYSNRFSNVKIDFYRSYHHTRSKWVKTERLEEETDDTILYGHIPNGFTQLEHRLWVDGLCEQLNPRDAQILRLLDRGHTQQEIAKRLGYANHSGVSKRIKKYIRPLLIKEMNL